jgi:hypothetical protein
MLEFHETTIASRVECPTAIGKSFWGAWTDLAASSAWRGQRVEAAAAVVELLKVRPDFTVETLAQGGAQYSDNPTFRKGSSSALSREYARPARRNADSGIYGELAWRRGPARC